MEPNIVPLGQSGLVAETELKGGVARVDPNHVNSDVDSSHLAQHHTIGVSANQVNHGLHTHNGVDSRLIENITGVGRTSYTPTWESNGVQPVKNNGILVGDWCRFGPMVFFNLLWVKGSTDTLGTGDYFFGLPVPVVGGLIGNVVSGLLFCAGKQWPVSAQTGVGGNRIGNIVPASAKTEGTLFFSAAGWGGAIANGNNLSLQGWYWAV